MGELNKTRHHVLLILAANHVKNASSGALEGIDSTLDPKQFWEGFAPHQIQAESFMELKTGQQSPEFGFSQISFGARAGAVLGGRHDGGSTSGRTRGWTSYHSSPL
jgi:hypothetical protein